MGSIIWEDNKAILAWKRTLNGAERFGFREIDFDFYGISRGGLLEQALEEVTFPLHHSVVNQTVRMVELHKNDFSCIKILGTPTSKLSRDHISLLYETFESSIKNILTISKETRNTVSSQFRNVISKCNATLVDGTPVCSVRFHSCFESHMGSQGKLAASMKKASKSLLNEERLSSICHDDSESLRNNMQRIAQEELQRIKNACWKIVESYKKIREHQASLLEKYREVPRVGGYPWALDSDRALGLKLSSLENLEFYRIEVLRRLMEPKHKGSVASALKISYGYSYVFNPFIPQLKAQITAHEYFYCSFYMPRIVILATQCLLLCHSCWNVSPLMSLTPRNIIRMNGYFQVNSVKTKTNAAESFKIFEHTHPELYELVCLLLDHHDNIDKY